MELNKKLIHCSETHQKSRCLTKEKTAKVAISNESQKQYAAIVLQKYVLPLLLSPLLTKLDVLDFPKPSLCIISRNLEYASVYGFLKKREYNALNDNFRVHDVKYLSLF